MVVDEGEDVTHMVIEGEVISTGNENILPSDVGTVVRDEEGGILLCKNSHHQWTPLIIAFIIWKLPLV